MTKRGGLWVLCGTACHPPYSSASLLSPIDQAGVGETRQWWVLGWIPIGRCPSKFCGDRPGAGGTPMLASGDACSMSMASPNSTPALLPLYTLHHRFRSILVSLSWGCLLGGEQNTPSLCIQLVSNLWAKRS